MTVDNAANVYTYDAEGRVTQVSNGSYVTTYTYDGNGQRVGKQSTMASKLYWYGPDGKILNESDTSGNVTDRFGWFNGEMVARLDTSGNVLHYLYHDHLGSTRLVVTPTGQVQDDLDYYPFGTAIPKQSSSGNNYQFTGYETDTESQTEHAWFRNLNPNLGRYMRPDPYEGSYVPYDPQSMNRYSYVGNRPLIFMDQYGLSCVTFDDGSMGDDGDGNGCAAAFIDPDGTDEDMEVVNVDGGAWGDDGNGGPWGGTIYGAIGPGGSSGSSGGGSGNCSQQPGGGPSGGIVYGTGGGVGAGAGGQGYTNSGTATNYAGQQGTAVSQTYNTNSNTILGLFGGFGGFVGYTTAESIGALQGGSWDTTYGIGPVSFTISNGDNGVNTYTLGVGKTTSASIVTFSQVRSNTNVVNRGPC